MKSNSSSPSGNGVLKNKLLRLVPSVNGALKEAEDLRRSNQEEEANKVQRERREEALSQSEELFRLAMEHSSIGMALVDINGRWIRVNQALCQIVGYTAEELLARDFQSITHPDDLAYSLECRDKFIAGLISSYQLEKRYLHKDGHVIWVSINISLLRDAQGNPRCFVSQQQDITERKRVETALRESKERFRQLADNITQVFWITDLTGTKIYYLSKAYESIWGRSCQSLYQAPETWNNATHPDDRARVCKAFQTASQHNIFDETYRIIRPDGTLRWIRDRGFPVHDSEGKVYRLAGIAEDITEQRKLEEQLRHSQKMEAMGTLAGGIAHDFNNILSSINGYGELAKMTLGKSNKRVSDHMDCILKSAKRASDLVRQILTFSRQQESNRQVIQAREEVEETLKLLRATIPSSIQFKTSFAPILPPILADATQIHQVLMNLGINAWHAMRNQSGILEIRVENFEADASAISAQPRLQPGSYLHLSVGDTGCGMDKATLERIFEPFFTTKGHGDGTGLGLSVVHGIMQSHEGLITVDSRPGVGTIFHLYFPASKGEIQKTPSTTSGIIHGKGKTILYVDDEGQLAELAKATLEAIGYQVEALTNVTEALNLVQSNPFGFDLVITDQTMPNMLGTEFACRLQKIRSDLPIILVSGYTTSLTRENLQAMGIRDLLQKPYNIKSLAETVHNVLSEKML